jgi:hypothetical protein
MGERTVPIQYLNDESKDEAREMKDFDGLIFDSPNGSDEEKNDPEKMDDNHTVCKDFVNHFLLDVPLTPSLSPGGRGEG